MMRRLRQRGERGYSLVELVITIAIMAVVMGAIAGIMNLGVVDWNTSSRTAEDLAVRRTLATFLGQHLGTSEPPLRAGTYNRIQWVERNGSTRRSYIMWRQCGYAQAAKNTGEIFYAWRELRENPVPNPSFESGLTGWTTWGSATLATTSGAAAATSWSALTNPAVLPTGTIAGLVTGPAIVDPGLRSGLTSGVESTAVPAFAGDALTVSASFAAVNGPVKVSVGYTFYNAAKHELAVQNVTQSTAPVTLAAGTARRISITTVPAPAGAVSVTAIVSVAPVTTGVSVPVAVDSVAILPAQSADASYLDGNTAAASASDAGWDGSANNAISRSGATYSALYNGARAVPSADAVLPLPVNNVGGKLLGTIPCDSTDANGGQLFTFYKSFAGITGSNFQLAQTLGDVSVVSVQGQMRDKKATADPLFAASWPRVTDRSLTSVSSIVDQNIATPTLSSSWTVSPSAKGFLVAGGIDGAGVAGLDSPDKAAPGTYSELQLKPNPGSGDAGKVTASVTLAAKGDPLTLWMRGLADAATSAAAAETCTVAVAIEGNTQAYFPTWQVGEPAGSTIVQTPVSTRWTRVILPGIAPAQNTGAQLVLSVTAKSTGLTQNGCAIWGVASGQEPPVPDAYRLAVLSDGPAGYWRLNDASAPLVDQTGTTTLTGAGTAPLFTQEGPMSARAVSRSVNFASGSGTLETTGALTPVTAASGFTVGFWAKLPSGGCSLGTGVRPAVSLGQIQFSPADTTVSGCLPSFRFGTSQWQTWTPLRSGFDNTWHQYVVTVPANATSAGTAKLYVDGQLVTTTAGNSTTGAVYTPGKVIVAGNGFVGQLSEVAVFPSALSAARVLAQYGSAYDAAAASTTTPGGSAVNGGGGGAPPTSTPEVGDLVCTPSAWTNAQVTCTASGAVDTSTWGLRNPAYDYQVSSQSDFARTVSTGTSTGVFNAPIVNATSPLADGTYFVRARSADRAGNVSAWTTTRTVQIDVTTPALPTLSCPAGWQPAGTTAACTASGASDALSGLRTSNAYDVEYARNNTFTTGVVSSTSSGAFTVPATNISGTWYVRVRSVDNAGNTSAWTATQTVQIRGTSPTQPALSCPAGWRTTQATCTASGSTSDPNVALANPIYSYQISTSNTFATVAASGTTNSTFLVPQPLSDGTWYVRVLATDESGSTSAWSTTQTVQIDTTAPPVPTIACQTAWSQTTGTCTITATADPLSGSRSPAYDYQISSSTAFTTLQASGTTGTTLSPASLPDGIWYVRVRQVDNVANASAWSSNSTLSIDTALPTVPTLSCQTAWRNTIATCTITGGSDALSGLRTPAYDYRFSTSSTFASGVTQNTSSGSFTVPASLLNGQFYVQARSVDQALNVSAWTASQIVKIDTIAPTVPTVTCTSGWIATQASCTASGSTDAASGLAAPPYTWRATKTPPAYDATLTSDQPTRLYQLGDTGTWTRVASPTASNLFAVAVNSTGTIWVAVGAGGTILRSTDGTTWTAQTSGVTADLNAVTWANTQFVAMGSAGTVLTSTDGATWTRRDTIATGGTTSFSGNDVLRTFTGSGTLTTIYPSISMQYLVVGGGGGGGVFGGGGGGGGLLTGTTTMAAGATTVTIGAGGVAATVTDNGVAGLNGGNSSLGTIAVATGGGGGGTRNGAGSSYAGGNGRSGGSGGGGSNSDTATPGYGGAGTSGQGNAGGNGGTLTTGTPNYSHGGGGGAGGVGGTGKANGTVGASGGPGVSVWGTTYAGGGGGGVYTNGSVGIGGVGGGGNGGGSYTGAPQATAGAANTGGGGGGGAISNVGGAGGSGIVIVRYTPVNTFTTVAASASLIVAGDTVGNIATSSDGVTWTYRTSQFASTPIRAIDYDNGMFVAVGDSGKISTSTDGVTWTARTSGSAANLTTVAYGSGTWVAAGSAGALLTSTNATTWTSRTSGFGTDQINGVLYSSKGWTLVGAAGKVVEFSDGSNWTLSAATRSTFGTANLQALVENSRRIVAVGLTGLIAEDGSNGPFATDTGTGTSFQYDVSTFAGSGTSGSGSGTGTAATFSWPQGVVADADGDAFTADAATHIIRKITPTGVVTTFAGTANATGPADGTGAAARFNNPVGLAIDSADNLYVAEKVNNKIRKITPAGVVTTLAGSGATGSADGTGAAATFNQPHGIAVDASGNVYVADRGNNLIRKITPAGVVTTLAGAAGVSGSADGRGDLARFNQPTGIAVDTFGNVIVSDTSSNTLRRITPAGIVSTLAGLPGSSGATDATGSSARFNQPALLASDGMGGVLVADYGNNKIRQVSRGGVVTTLAGTGVAGAANGIGTAATFTTPYGVALDRFDNVYVTDTSAHRVRRVILDGHGVYNNVVLGNTVAMPTGVTSMPGTFNGSNAFVQLPTIDLFTNASFSVEALVRPTAVAASCIVSAYSAATQGNAMNVCMNASGFYTVDFGGTAIAATSGAATANTWQHLLVTYNSSTRTVSIYVNGVLAGSGTMTTNVTAAASTMSYSIGRNSSGASYFTGQLSNIAFYGAALTAAQAAGHNDSAFAVTSVTSGTSTGAFTVPTVLNDGTYVVEATASDTAGNTSAWSTTKTVQIDLSAPTVPTVTCPSGWQALPVSCTVTGASDLLSGLPAAPYDVQYSKNADFSAPTTTDTSVASATIPAGTADGTWYVRVRAKDAIGNTSSWSATDVLYIDATAPTTPTAACPTAWSSVAVSCSVSGGSDAGSGLDNPPYEYRYSQSVTFASGVTQSTTTGSVSVPAPLAEGVWYFQARAIDRSNNTSAWTASQTVNIDTSPPTAPSLSCAASWASTQTTCTISGGSDSGAGLATVPYAYEYTNSATVLNSGSGGTISEVTINGLPYIVHTFTATGAATLTLNQDVPVEYLVVGAGGSVLLGNTTGGSNSGGGGGGGTATNVGTPSTLAAGSYAISVGAGAANASGGSSSITGVATAAGGSASPNLGQGPGGASGNAKAGGSGGVNGGGGGGGAAANGAGTTCTGGQCGGIGGAGIQSFIRYGVGEYFGGGGGGAGYSVGGAGGAGGGGTGGSSYGGGGAATPNTGGGAGGGGHLYSGAAQPGASGIVIVRYPKYTPSFTTGVTSGTTSSTFTMPNPLTEGAWYVRARSLDGASNYSTYTPYRMLQIDATAPLEPNLAVTGLATPNTWTVQTSGFGTTQINAAYAGLVGSSMGWVALGSTGGISTSLDGVTWTARTSPLTSGNTVFYANSLWVAAGNTGALATSTDGVTWTSRTTGLTGNIADIAYGNGLWVIVDSAGGLATSTDGITWTARTSSFAGTAINAVTYGEGMFVAGGASSKIATSPDGITWTQRASGFGGTDAINAIADGFDGWLIAGANGKMATAIDPTTDWTLRTSGFGTEQILDADYANGLWMIAGGTTTSKLSVATSLTGSWTAQTSGFGTNLARDVTYGPGMWLTVGNAGQAATMNYGGSWQSLASLTVKAYGGSDVLTGIAGYQYRTSTNGGATWGTATSGSSVAVTAEGETLVQFRSVDNAGNVSGWAPSVTNDIVSPTAIVRLDRTAPTAPTVSGGSLSWQNAPARLTAAGSTDANAGVQSFGARTSTNQTSSWSGSTMQTTNLLTNGSFDTSISSWVARNGSTLATESTTVYEGAGSLKVTTAASTIDSGAISSGITSVQPLQRYTVSAWVNAPDGASMNLIVREVNRIAGDIVLANPGQSFTGTGGWQRVSMSVTPRVAATGLNVRIVTAASVAAYSFYVDNVQIEAGVTTSTPQAWTTAGAAATPIVRTQITSMTAWTARTSNAGTNQLNAVAYGNGMFVAVGNAGTMVTSPDGVTWTARTSGFSTTNINAVAYANGLWVAVGDAGKLATTTDPTGTWTQKTSGFAANNITSVAFDSGLWVLAGSAGQLFTSPDLSIVSPVMTSRTSTFTTNQINGLADGNGIWVAVGAAGQLASSTNGTTWTARTAGVGTTAINAVAFVDDTFVAVTATGGLITSTDGYTWTARTSGAGANALQAVASGAGFALVGGAAGALTSSSDLVTWTARSSSFSTQTIRGLAYGEGIWVAAGTNGTTTTSSSGTGFVVTGEQLVQFSATDAAGNTSTWAPSHTASVPVAGGTVRIDRIEPSAPTLSCPSSATWYTSAQDCTVTGGADTGGSGLRTANYDYQFSTDATFLSGVTQGTSTGTVTVPSALADGIYNVRVRTVDATGNASEWTAAQQVKIDVTAPAVTVTGGSLSWINGRWVQRTSGTSNDLNSIAVNAAGTVRVAVGANGTITRSTDGATWAVQTSGVTTNLNTVAWASTQFVAMGAVGTVLTSPDGITWTRRDTVASGGTQSFAGNDVVRTFTASGSLVSAYPSLSYQYLVVAGGGAGGNGYEAANNGGGGGGGGVLSGSKTFTASTYPVVVGNGGAQGTMASGGSSSVNAVSATGGGGGGGRNTSNVNEIGKNGGSGGGGGPQTPNGAGAGTAGQGTSGAAGNPAYPYQGGGGGGAGQGGNANCTGCGGNGVLNAISGTNTWYAGGGGGGADASAGSGGAGGGAAAVTYLSSVPPTAATPNTGGGGGGGASRSYNAAGSQGGSGIVIVRYTPINAFTTVTFGASLIVAGDDLGNIATSTNGSTWTYRTSQFGTTPIRAITFANSMFVAVGDSGKVSTSTDGITWTSRTSGSTESLRSIAYGNNTWAAAGTNGALLTSTDATTWTARTSGFGTDTINAVHYGSRGWTIGGTGGDFAYSDDATTWTMGDYLVTVYGTYAVNGFAEAGGRLSGVGIGGRIADDAGSVVTFTAASSDGSSGINAGTLEYRTSTNGGTTWSAAAASAGTQVVRREGETLIQFRISDQVGNQSDWIPAAPPAVAGATARIDVTMPSAPTVSCPSSWVTTAQTCTFSASTDGGAGLGATPYNFRYSQNATFATGVTTGTTTSTATIPSPLSSGTWYVQAQSVDGVGLQSDWSSSSTVRVDTVAPVAPTALTCSAGWRSTAANCTVTGGSDALSGLASPAYSYQFSLSNTFASGVTTDTTSGTFSVPSPLANGVWYVRAQTVDFAGNGSTWTATQTVQIDVTAPTVSVTGGSFSWTSGLWTERTSNTTSALYGIATNTAGTVWVAVGAGGTIVRSTDGVTWAVQTSGVTTDLYTVTWASTQFVAMGTSGTVLTSADGITWTRRDTIASGGTPSFVGNDVVRTYTSSGSLVSAYPSLSYRYLVVAGGGPGGAGCQGGGGGAGGVLTGTTTAAANTYTITVGGGGVPSSTGGSNGGNSVALGFTASGGGRGAGEWSGCGFGAATPVASTSGGSGGGGSHSLASVAGSSGIAGQGNAGGSGYTNSPYVGGGGGGAGAVGGNGGTGGGGPGGAGISSNISGSTLWYGGGGSGSYRSGAAVAGGTGGGGASGGSALPGSSGTANTGGGGGAGNNNATAGNGGSGIVIVRYTPINAFTTVAYGAGLIVAGDDQGNIATSPDGITWTYRTSQFGAMSVENITFANNMFVAVGGAGKISTSTNGITWTARTSGATQDFMTLTYGNGTWVAAGWAGTLYTSTDAITWTARTSGFGALKDIFAAHYGIRGFTSAGSSGTIGISENATSWTTTTDATAIFGSTAIYGMVEVGSDLVFVGAGGKIATDADVVFTATGADSDSGLNATAYEGRLSTDGGSTWSTPRVLPANKLAVRQSGETLVQIRSTDMVGNQSAWTPAAPPAVAAGTARIDTTSPTVPTVTCPSTYAKVAHTCTFSGSTDTGSGLQSPAYEYRYSLSSTFASGVTAGTAASSTPVPAALADGTWYVQARAIDVAGNRSAWSASSTVRIDISAPTGMTISSVGTNCAGTSNSTWAKGASCVVTASGATDAGSGGVTYRWSMSGAQGTSSGTGATGPTITTDGTTQVSFWAADAVGNETSASVFTVQMDSTGPVLTLSGGSTTWQKGVWTERSSGTTQNLRAVTASGSNPAVAVGTGGTILRSTGSGTWTSATSGVTHQLNAVTYHGSRIVAVGDSDLVLVSNDLGVTWTPYSVVATGGTVTWRASTVIHTFTSNGSLVWTGPYSLYTQFFMVGGGGAGGSGGNTGGGGGGGVVSNSEYKTAGTYPVVIGGGGGPIGAAYGNNGGNTTMFGYTAYGGGGGGGNDANCSCASAYSAGRAGGNGGGGANWFGGATSGGTPSQGNYGGNGTGGPNAYGSGGGGGAGGRGGDGNTGSGGGGGGGYGTYIRGPLEYYGGGGGGGSISTWASGGSGGGGNSCFGAGCYGGNGGTNTGGGGGGTGRSTGGNGVGGTGGSGIAIVTYSPNAMMTAVASDDTNLVAGDDLGNLFTSATNGATWVSRGAPNGANAIRAITTGNGAFIAVGDGGKIATSLNSGASWTVRSSGTTNALRAISYSPLWDTWIAVGDGGTVLKSTDYGATWTSHNAGMGTSNLTSVTPLRGGWMVFGAGGANAYSTDGVLWTSNTLGALNGRQLNGPVALMSDRVIGVANGGVITDDAGIYAQISYTVSDPGSGANTSTLKYRTSTDGGTTWSAATTTSGMPAINRAGETLVQMQMADNLGNLSAWQPAMPPAVSGATVRRDVDLPTAPTVSCPAGWFTSTKTCTVSGGADAGSGLAATPYNYQISLDPAFGSGVTSGTTTGSVTVPSALASGVWYVRAQAVDNAANLSSWSANATVSIDVTAPTAPTLTGTGCTSGTVTTGASCVVTASGSTDANSGLSSPAYTFTKSGKETGTSTGTSVTISTPGVTTVTVQAVDNAGNLSTASTFTVAIAFASGGSVTSYSSGGSIYEVHTFTASSTLVVNAGAPTTADYLIVAGGGSGGAACTNCSGAGGGGAGGVRYATAAAVSAASYPIVVGSGGAAVAYATNGNNGGDSSFNGVTATGGGGGATRTFLNGRAGGSGGGGEYTGTGGASSPVTSPVQGYAGGTATSTPVNRGGGGGGATSGGASGTTGNGGNGYTTSISGTSQTYAGGGGGGGYQAVGGAGGTGGGGTGGNQGTGSSASYYGGGGGGGGAYVSAGGNGGAGYQGIVIISFKMN